jgi:hypothetical protein
MNLKRISANVTDGYFRIMVLSIILLVYCSKAFAQEPPPRPVQVTVVQNLAFGAFSLGASGGTVSVDYGGSRVATGDVVLLNLGFSFTAASFRLVGNAGTVVSIINGADVSLPGSNGGSMTLHIGSSNPSSPFVINVNPPDYTNLSIGGTLTVGNTASNPPGSYSGSFEITFIQE